jgi:hypothetical protein
MDMRELMLIFVIYNAEADEMCTPQVHLHVTCDCVDKLKKKKKTINRLLILLSNKKSLGNHIHSTYTICHIIWCSGNFHLFISY